MTLQEILHYRLQGSDAHVGQVRSVRAHDAQRCGLKIPRSGFKDAALWIKDAAPLIEDAFAEAATVD